MGGSEESQAEVLFLIQSTYVPFLKKLIAHLEKKKANQPKSYDKLKYVYKTFCESDSKEKIEVYEACKDMLERWHKRYKDMRAKGSDKQNSSSSYDAGAGSEDSQSDASLSGVKVASSNANQAPNTPTSGLSIVSVMSCSKSQGQQPASAGSKGQGASQDGVYFHDEVEIESSDSSSYSILPVPTQNKTEKLAPPINIKKEKDPLPVATPVPVQSAPSITQPKSITNPALPTSQIPILPKPLVANQPAPQPAGEAKEVVFVCASCQFRTTNEADFMKHARTDHRTDLSLWCKQCGKCFSNAGVLVAHIKENNCQKEDMIYRCGVKDCTFETPSGQTFVHHLRHCHKGSPFIFCIHCQKIFTLPHCLILHMQNECPFKEKNRRNPSANPNPAPPPPPAPTPSPVQTPIPTPVAVCPAVKPQVQAVPVQATVKPPIPAVQAPAIAQSLVSTIKRGTATRGRGRGRGRMVRSKFSDSSDSDDPDDPSWKPEENLNNQPLRRSARWAKKVIDAKEPDLNESDSSVGKHKKSERPSKTFFYCPCCDFSALFKSLLEGHYVTDHKNPKKNSCTVCNVKFESKQYFLEHFAIHEKEKAEGKTPAVEKEEPAVEKEEPNKSSQSSIPIEIVPQAKTISQNTQNSAVIIPYQTAIQEKLQKESKLKSFDDLKSANDIQKMKTETKLQHFYKCVIYNCTFTTDDSVFYVNHLHEHHKGKKLHCAYCLEDYMDAKLLAEHMLKDHGKRCYQCSLCFYRGSSKPHVQIHIRNVHTLEKAQVYKCSQHLPPGYVFKTEKEEESDLTTTWPYVCAIGDCSFKSYDPKEFKKHNDISHRSVSVFFCHYCKVDFISFKRLMSHYHLHGINNFQCTYCVHGSDTKEEILVHLCNNHADKPFKVHVRTPQDGSSTTKKNTDNSVSKGPVDRNEVVNSPMLDNVVSTRAVKDENISKNATFPIEVPVLGKEVFCRVGFCGELLDDMNVYLNHLVEVHCSLNILCPYCSFVADKVSEFESHLKCHGPHLFACAEERCVYFSHEESDVALHMINASHQHDSSSPRTVRKKMGCTLPKLLVNETLLVQNKAYCSDAYVCPFCHYRCAKQEFMKNHLYVELVYKRFQCNLCKMKCCSRAEAKQHFTVSHSHHNIKCSIDGIAEIECFVTNYLSPKVQKFAAKGLKIERDNWLQESGLPSSKCRICSISLPTVVAMHHHMVACLSHDYQPYLCNHCGAKATDLIRMKCHTSEVHPGSEIKYSVFPNKLLEEQHARRLQDLRLNFLKEVVLSVVDKSCVEQPQLVPKYYKCAYCKFADKFRSNIVKHCIGCHKEKDVNVEKIKGLQDPVTSSPLQSDTNDDSSHETPEPMDTCANEHFLCVYCTKKTVSLAEMDKHVVGHHSLPENGIYPYFYCPDPSCEFPSDDSELFECAYCSVSQENLYHLKRHCNNLHSDAVFQVRGHKTKDGAMIKCDYCECKVVSQELLLKHCQFYHPSKSHKSINDVKKQLIPKKRKSETSVMPVKRAKYVPEMYQCAHCSEESDMILKITAHCETAHPNLPVKYKTISKSENSSSDNIFPCEFCSFIGDRNLLSKHISQKHKNCVCCGHCNKYLESLALLELHTTAEHRGRRTKLASTYDSSICESSNSSLESSGTSKETKTSSEVESSGRKREPIDLSTLTVHLKNEATSVDAKLPVVYLTKMFSMFPKVVLEDFKKGHKS